SVNLPSANLPRSGKPRICVIHKNISNMISGITAVMSKSGCNIDNMINKSRGDVAYSIFDIDCEPPENLHTGISSIEGVIRVRVI
ncbi:MAG: 3-phosphoglycerate dehydrogenase, partial [Oscillospiraceae bacterium]|nr:3-phosphoglycerate dehydrogenase [Oscillospiraceae bacterium]